MVTHIKMSYRSCLIEIVRKAISKNKIAMPFEDVTIGLKGNVSRTEIERA